MNNANSVRDLFYQPSKSGAFVPLETFTGLFQIGEIFMITAQAGVGKSWLIRYAMNQASVGRDIFGSDAETYSSLCFNGELSEYALSLRDRLTRNCVYDPEKIIYITNEALVKKGITPSIFGDEEGTKFLHIVQEAIKESNAKAVFFDSLVSFNGGDENSTKDMSAVFNWLLKLAKGLKIAVVLTHHLRKQGKEKTRTIDDVAGSSAMIRLCQTVYLVEKLGGTTTSATNKGYETRLLVRQLRNASLVRDPFIFTIRTEEYDTNEISTELTEHSHTTFTVQDAEGQEIIPDNQETRTKKKNVHTALKALFNAKKDVTSSDAYTYVQDICELDVTDRTIREVINEMTKSKEITRLEEKRGRENVYVLTKKLELELAEEEGRC